MKKKTKKKFTNDEENGQKWKKLYRKKSQEKRKAEMLNIEKKDKIQKITITTHP